MEAVSRARLESRRSREGAEGRSGTKEGGSVGDREPRRWRSGSGLVALGWKMTSSGSLTVLDRRGEGPVWVSRGCRRPSVSLGRGRTELPLAMNMSKVAFLKSISASSLGVRSGSEDMKLEGVRSEAGRSEARESRLWSPAWVYSPSEK